MLLCAVHATLLEGMPDAAACVLAVGAAANTSTPMTNLRMHLEQLALRRSAASAGECTLLLLSPAPACALDLPAFLRLGALRDKFLLQPQHTKRLHGTAGLPTALCQPAGHCLDLHAGPVKAL